MSEISRRGHHAAHEAAHRSGERVRLRHVLFAVTPGIDVVALRQQTFVTALRQYLRLLAGKATVEGVDLDSADTPLVQ